MRGVVLFCSLFAFLFATVAADAQSQAAKRRGAAKKTEAAAPAPVDPRPRMRRGDDATPVTAATAPAVAQKNQKKRSARRKPGQGAQAVADGAAQGAKPGPRDVAACAQVREPDAAIAGCTRIIEDARQKPKGRTAAYFNRGNAYSAKSEHDKAIADFDEAIKLDPRNASALNNRGTARNDAGDADGAIADFNAAIKLNARYAAAYLNRANAYAAKGDTARAIDEYGAAIQRNKRNVNAMIARGALQLASGATAKAQADMKQAARLAPKNAYSVLWLDIAERRAKQKGMFASGAKGARGLDMKAWPAPVVRLYTGEATVDATVAAADSTNPAVKIAQVCEANFYGGEYALIGGDRAEAVKLFQTAAKDCPRGFLEGIAAAAELKGLGEKVGAN